MIITSLPIIIFGIFDKHYPKIKLNFSPLLYLPGAKKMEYN